MSGSSPAPSAGANHIIRIIIHEQNTDLFHIARPDGGRLQQGRTHHHRCRTGADHHVRHRPGRLSRQGRPGVYHYALLPVRRSGRLLLETGRNGQDHLDRTAAHLPVRLRQRNIRRRQRLLHRPGGNHPERHDRRNGSRRGAGAAAAPDLLPRADRRAGGRERTQIRIRAHRTVGREQHLSLDAAPSGCRRSRNGRR